MDEMAQSARPAAAIGPMRRLSGTAYGATAPGDVDRIAYNGPGRKAPMPPEPAAVPAAPYPFALVPAATALVIIDMQRDFLQAGGFGAMLGNDVSMLTRVVEPLPARLAAPPAARATGLHTREGHPPPPPPHPPRKLAPRPPATPLRGPG